MQVERTELLKTGFRLRAAKVSGERVSNAWVICPQDRDNRAKALLIPDELSLSHDEGSKALALGDEPAFH